ncbi:Putative coenzyme PQQ biosynthesis protein E, PpqE1, radical SAM domain heme biosynthesis protein, Predicted Fe-S oxidoreductases [Desulfamplus magnetovallimortis]|uniref:Pre-heme d1 synthase n=1 Tax=Desulfamplus magnetovallimortis TaxID=1246637 RepID=A0A1W1H4L7_9BACT|nr:12,18-didecarboxysiroheme deacetylase [Desulfamplus magnetovallimortis]SLM27420.1 Putative coenzyme PQQ biosynthesis protein E, PpqE1, radical SAM domain heme biosynthesis protein, Predicted Fe-S oxidoreductases [Desulfamplus magnetovallimortis]
MIGISKLYCSTVEPSDTLRYARHSGKLPSHLLQFSIDKKPVVVWNMTRRCNLRCVHCYAQSEDISYENELTHEQSLAMIDDLAQFGVPVLLFSGGEPLVHPRLAEYAEYAVKKGMRAVISTNGTLITKEKATVLKEIGLSYVGISLDGLEKTHDNFRGIKGSFQKALQGIRNCQEAGIKVGLRFTINKRNVHEIPGIFDLLEKMDIPRACFYHLVYSGRASAIANEDLSHEETRKTLDLIMERTRDLHDRNLPKEILTVDNHADGPYIYMKLLQEDPERAAEVLDLLQMNEGNNSGRGFGCISWDGEVHPDQFWRDKSLGNIKERPFSEIWTDSNNDFLMKLKEKKAHVKGRCMECRWLDICGGNFRARAESIKGDPWDHDPACYLTDEEIKKK